MTSNIHFLGLRRLLQALLALAVLFAPVTANAMEGPSGTAISHHEQKQSSAHCAETPGKVPTENKADGKTCCASMCMAVAVVPFARVQQEAAAPVVVVSSAPKALFDIAEALATPPPRSA